MLGSILEKMKTQKFKLIFTVSVLLILAVVVLIRYSIYQKEGEKNMPYSISKVIVISKANKYENNKPNNVEEQPEEENENVEQAVEQTQEDNSIWNFDIIQTNDIYISIEKKAENVKKDEKIKNITISNIKIEENPVKGTLKAFMPNSLDGEKYKYTDDYAINENLTYRAAEVSNLQNLQISNNGGVIGFSIANTQIGKYVSGDEEEILYNGTLLSKLGITDADVKSKVSFDLMIELDNGKKYSGKITLNITCDGLVEKGTSQQEITDFSDVIFKRN